MLCLHRTGTVDVGEPSVVVAVASPHRDTAFLACRGEPLSMIALKRWCSENLPLYMIPDRFSFHDALPKTSTDKIDYQALAGRT